MEPVYAEIELINPNDASVPPVKQRARVADCIMTLCIPKHIAEQLGLKEIEKREFVKTDGLKMLVPYVGPVQVQIENRKYYTGALVLGIFVIVGKEPSEDSNHVIPPRLTTVPVKGQTE